MNNLKYNSLTIKFSLINIMKKFGLILLYLDVSSLLNVLIYGKDINTKWELLIFFCMGIAFISGTILILSAKVLKNKMYEKLSELSYMEAEECVSKNPEFKSWFINNNNSYAQFYTNEIINYTEGSINIQNNESKKNILIIKMAASILFIIIASIGINFIANKYKGDNTKKEQSAKVETTDNTEDTNSKVTVSEDEKYEKYVKLNNDITEFYDYTINYYINAEGSEETLENADKEVFIRSVFSYMYDDMNNVSEILKKDSTTNLDKKAENLIEPLTNAYRLTNQIYAAYGNELNDRMPLVKTNASKEELHKEFLSAIAQLDKAYREFSAELTVYSRKVELEDLQAFKDSGNIKDYERLKIIIESRKISDYIIDNNITNDNLFSMNLNEYEALLAEYNKAYEEFKSKSTLPVNNGYYLDVKNFNVLANSVPIMVEQKNLDATVQDGSERGTVTGSSDEDIQERFNERINSLIQSYNN